MKKYELTYLSASDLTEEQVKNLQDKLAALITAKNGTVAEFQKAYKKRLAYPVKRKDTAFVNTVIYSLEPGLVEAFNKELKEEDRILRSLNIVYEPITMKENSRSRRRASKKAAEEENKEEIKIAAKKEKPKAELAEIGEKLDEILS
jgi:small subunit ribosomal protein S6